MKSLFEILAETADALDKNGQEALATKIDIILATLADKDYTIKDLEEVIPDENKFDSPVIEDEEYYEAVEKALQQKMTEDEKGALQKQLAEPPYIGYHRDRYRVEQLLEHDLIPMATERSPEGKLGEGSYGSVYKVDYQGKEVAAKITKRDYHSESKMNDEAHIWREILKIKNKLSPEAQRHIPEIYEIIESEDGLSNSQIIVMEALKPLPKRHVELLWRLWGDEKLLPQDPQWLSQVAFDAQEYVESTWETTVPKYIWQLLHKSVLEALPKKQGIYDLTGYLTDYLTDVVEKHRMGENILGLIYNYARLIASKVNAYKREELPTKYRRDEFPGLKEAPETRSFINALQELADNGIRWRDLHRGNLMMRPGTDELVIIDVGLYDPKVTREQL